MVDITGQSSEPSIELDSSRFEGILAALRQGAEEAFAPVAGDVVQYVNAKGETKSGEVLQSSSEMNAGTKGQAQVQLKSAEGGAVFALDESRLSAPEMSVEAASEKLLALVVDQLMQLNKKFDAFMDEAAMARLRAKDSEDVKVPGPNQRAPAGQDDSWGLEDLLGFSGIITAFGTAIATAVGTLGGLVIGQIKAAEALFKALGPDLSKLKSSLKSRVASIGTSIKAFITTIKTFFVDIGARISALAKENALFKALTNVGERIKALAKPFVDATKTIKGMLSGPAGQISKMFSSIGGYLKTFGATVAKVAGVVGKIFAPLVIIMTLFDTIKGAIDGYAEGGILGGLEGAINGFFTSLITKPLDLVKDAVAWVASKLGFDESAAAISGFSFTESFTKITGALFDVIGDTVDSLISYFGFDEGQIPSVVDLIGSIVAAPIELLKSAVSSILSLLGAEDSAAALDSFSFKELFQSVYNGIWDFITATFDYVKDIFTGEKGLGDVLGDVSSALHGFYKKVLQMVLPTPDTSAPWYSTGNLIAKAVPDSVYEYAGMDPKTGEITATSEPPEASSDTPEQIAKQGALVTQLFPQELGPGLTPVTSGNSGLNPVTAGNSGLTPVKSSKAFQNVFGSPSTSSSVLNTPTSTSSDVVVETPGVEETRRGEALSDMKTENATTLVQQEERAQQAVNPIINAPSSSSVVNNSSNQSVLMGSPGASDRFDSSNLRTGRRWG